MSEMIVRDLGLTEYEATWAAMKAFTATRLAESPDELWLTEHPPVYTLGLNRREVAMPLRNDIPVVMTDRGGKITYHGTGQVVIYLLMDLKRRGLSIRQLVSVIEGSIVSLLADYGIAAVARADAPGVYVQERKIAALGLRIKNGCCYHGLSLNVAMDLSPFLAIDPCGYRGMEVTQLRDLGIDAEIPAVAQALLTHLIAHLKPTS